MLSTATFGTGVASDAADSAGAVFGVGFFAVIGAKPDFVTAGCAAGSPLPAFALSLGEATLAFASAIVAPSLGDATTGSSAAVTLEVLLVTRGRVDDLAAVGFAALRAAGALGAFDLVVVFVAIYIP
jgi:hypothetical protein